MKQHGRQMHDKSACILAIIVNEACRDFADLEIESSM